MTQWALLVTLHVSLWALGCSALWPASRTAARKRVLQLACFATPGLVVVTLLCATNADAASTATTMPVATRDGSELRRETNLATCYIYNTYECVIDRHVTSTDSRTAVALGFSDKPRRVLHSAAIPGSERIALATHSDQWIDANGYRPRDPSRRVRL